MDINLISLGMAFYCPCHTEFHDHKTITRLDFCQVVAERERLRGAVELHDLLMRLKTASKDDRLDVEAEIAKVRLL